jgi:hypothetical protein
VLEYLQLVRQRIGRKGEQEVWIKGTKNRLLRAQVITSRAVLLLKSMNNPLVPVEDDDGIVNTAL